MRIFGFSLFLFSREVSLICFENVSKQKSKQFKELVIGISFRKKRQILAGRTLPWTVAASRCGPARFGRPHVLPGHPVDGERGWGFGADKNDGIYPKNPQKRHHLADSGVRTHALIEEENLSLPP